MNIQIPILGSRSFGLTHCHVRPCQNNGMQPMKSTTTGYDPSIHHLLRQIENNGTLTHNIIPSNTHMLVVPRLTPGRRAHLLCVCHRVCHGCLTKGGCCDPPVVALAGWQFHAALPLSKSTKNMANPRGSYIFGGCSCLCQLLQVEVD